MYTTSWCEPGKPVNTREFDQPETATRHAKDMALYGFHAAAVGGGRVLYSDPLPCIALVQGWGVKVAGSAGKLEWLCAVSGKIRGFRSSDEARTFQQRLRGSHLSPLCAERPSDIEWQAAAPGTVPGSRYARANP